jgi:hypothetical protein
MPLESLTKGIVRVNVIGTNGYLRHYRIQLDSWNDLHSIHIPHFHEEIDFQVEIEGVDFIGDDPRELFQAYIRVAQLERELTDMSNDMAMLKDEVRRLNKERQDVLSSATLDELVTYLVRYDANSVFEVLLSEFAVSWAGDNHDS